MTNAAGIVGVDLQYSRATIGLREGMGQQMSASLVGDGTRRLVPSAIGPDGTWGSSAVEAFFKRAGTVAAAADHVLGWRVDPWSVEFLRGLRERLVAYLGGVTPDRRHGHDVCICTGQADAIGWEDQAGADADDGSPSTARSALLRCAAAGLNDVTFVRPTDALLCRWIAEWARHPSASGVAEPIPAKVTVLVVACGESWTAVAGYALMPGETRQLISRLPGTARRVERGCGEWSAGLARQVMARCREGTRPDAALAVLDATLELGALLGAQKDGETTEWSGPLADAMLMPLILRRREQAALEEVRLTTDSVAELVAKTLPEAGPARPVIVVGGIGAVWPYVTDALQPNRDRAVLWRSSEPEHDLAIGATWWPELRRFFSRGGEPRPPALTSAAAGTTHVPGAAGITSPRTSGLAPRAQADSAPRRPEDTPPWERDL
jgi:hypothetical protein